MALNSETGAIDVTVQRVRDLDAAEVRNQIGKAGVVAGVAAAVEVNANSTASLTAAQTLAGLVRSIPVAAITLTTPTAALLVAGIRGAKVGDTFNLTIFNNSAGANAITLAGGTGATLRGGTSILQNKSAILTFALSNVTAASEAYTVYATLGA